MNNAENKTVLADVGGFTPAIDTIVDELGFMCAGVFGVNWVDVGVPVPERLAQLVKGSSLVKPVIYAKTNRILVLPE